MNWLLCSVMLLFSLCPLAHAQQWVCDQNGCRFVQPQATYGGYGYSQPGFNAVPVYNPGPNGSTSTVVSESYWSQNPDGSWKYEGGVGDQSMHTAPPPARSYSGAAPMGYYAPQQSAPAYQYAPAPMYAAPPPRAWRQPRPVYAAPYYAPPPRNGWGVGFNFGGW